MSFKDDLLVFLKVFFDFESRLGDVVFEDDLISTCGVEGVELDEVRQVLWFLLEKQLILEVKRGYFKWKE